MSITKDTQNTPKPWERQPDETPKAYEAFCIYRDLKDIRDPESKRSLDLVVQEMGKSRTLFERWSSKYEWVKRVTAYDDEQERLVREEEEKQRIKDIREMRKRHAKIANSMMLKAARALDNIPEDEIKAGDISRMVDTASKLERISLGDVGEVIEERQGEAALPAVTFYMPSNNRDNVGDNEEEEEEE